MIKYSYFILCALLCFSCGEPTTGNTATQEPSSQPQTKEEAFEKAKQEMATKVEDLKEGQAFPSIDVSVLENLWENCDFVDYVYYELPISASLDNQASIRSALSHVADQAAAKLPNCKALGRVFYQIDGENVLQGDIFFSKGCTYFLWVDNKGKYYAGNLMMDTGMKFFASNIQAAQGKVQPGQ